MKRVALLVALLICIGIALSLSTPTFANTLSTGQVSGSTNPSAITTTLNPDADSYVSSAYPTTNYGTLTSLRVDGSPYNGSILRFNVSGTTLISKATLRIYANSSLSAGFNVYQELDNNWSETGITYNQSPQALGSLIGTSGAVTAGTWLSVDVTSWVKANGTYSFILTTTNSTALSLGSRESANKPQLIVVSGSPATATATSVAGGNVTMNPVADAYVDSANPSTNYGTLASLRTDGSPVVRSYVRFSVSGLTAAITKATLRLYANSSLIGGNSVQAVANNTWSETTINYGNAPALGAVLGTTGNLTAGTWVSVDVTPYVTGNGTFSFAISSSNATAESLASRESANKPQLVLSAGGVPPLPTATKAATSTPPPASTATPPPSTVTPPPPTATPSSSDPFIFFTGDSRSGCTSAAGQVVSLIQKYGSSVPVLFNGDATDSGAYSQFTSCFDTTYGKIKSQLKPVPGNHEYMTSGASGYYQYFGAQAGPSGKGYYSYNVGTWHLVNLNSEIDISATSAQLAWLKSDLAANPTRCSLAIWHRPRFSSGNHGNNTDTGTLFQALYDANGEIVMGGHDHDYERFAPQNPSGAADAARGIRQWVVGTAGTAFYSFATIRANSEFRNNTNYGALKLTLHPASYDWQFLNTSGSVIDSGSTACH